MIVPTFLYAGNVSDDIEGTSLVPMGTSPFNEAWQAIGTTLEGFRTIDEEDAVPGNGTSVPQLSSEAWQAIVTTFEIERNNIDKDHVTENVTDVTKAESPFSEGILREIVLLLPSLLLIRKCLKEHQFASSHLQQRRRFSFCERVVRPKRPKKSRLQNENGATLPVSGFPGCVFLR